VHQLSDTRYSSNQLQNKLACSSTIEHKRPIITKSTATSAEQPATPA